LRRILLDAGPLIALFHAKDNDHATCLVGFERLISQKTEMLIPSPIVYEVHKWLMHHASPQSAGDALLVMEESLRFLYVDEELFQTVAQLQRTIPMWRGTLEDATVAVIGFRYDVPVWTLNYRDLAAFQNLNFWNP
jgi:predicted nucleic acid-binding protein